MSKYELDVTKPANDPDNICPTVALEKALGCSLPNNLNAWPSGLTYAWNVAARDGAFDQALTLRDLGVAYLNHRLTRLSTK